jgi:SAM-dependent methyltransferase
MDRAAWNRRYASTDLVWSAAPNRFVAEELADLPPGRALDLAAGEGRNALWLAARGWTVTAVDFSDVALDKGREIAAQRGVEVDWVCEDLLSWAPPERAFDLVVVLYLQLRWEELEAPLRQAAAAVAPGGTFFLVAHDSDNLEHGYGGPTDPAVLYRAQDVARLLDGFEVLKAGPVRRPVETERGPGEAIDALVRAVRS